jgi:hypothetical protein
MRATDVLQCSSAPIQLRGKRGKSKNEKPVVRKAEHTQEEIQNFMIGLWQANPKDELDQVRADYAQMYKAEEGGWCDGWSYVLSQRGEELAEVWTAVDTALTENSAVTKTIAGQAMELARKASLYHIINGDPPGPDTQKLLDYQAAHYDLFETPASRETWRHDEGTPVKLYVIKEEIKSLEVGRTLRLTSPTHDAAVQRLREGFTVSETEKHGVQKVSSLDEVLLILKEWQEECRKTGVLFFTQSMVV